MGGAGVILAINLIVAGLLASAFLFLSFQDRGQGGVRMAGRWMALAYLCSMAYFGLEFLIANTARTPLTLVGAFGIFLAALVCMNGALARLYGGVAPWRLLAVLSSVALAVNIMIVDMPRDNFLRLALYQLPYAAVTIVGAVIVYRARRRGVLDNLLVGTLSAFAFQFLAKPFLATALGGPGQTEASYVATKYALFSQGVGTIFAMALALLAITVMVRDILHDARERSETDALSGLLNRRGFEDRARATLTRALETGLPVSLIICDLDRFKDVNDSFGHAAGDRAIEAFGDCLRQYLNDEHVAGRIGGEEFAIILPAMSIAGARLLAEAVRATFAATPIAGLPEGVRLTASFGVAELLPGEHFSDVLHRADGALYRAKDAGRDRVRLAEAANDPVERRAYRA